jgi:elongation factor P
MAKVSTSDFRQGLKIDIDGQPWLMVQNQFVKPGKGNAFNRTRLKNMMTGRVVEKTFKSGDTAEIADIEEHTVRLLYTDHEGAVFMDDNTFEQMQIFWQQAESVRSWLVDDLLYNVIFFKGEAITIEPPTFLEIKIIETAPGVRGDTASGRVLKPAKLETGAEVQVPIFLEEGEIVKVDTRTGDYVSRASK